MITARCQQCGQLYSAPESSIGQQVQCPICHVITVMPAGPPGPPVPELPGQGPVLMQSPPAQDSGGATAALVLGILAFPGMCFYLVPGLVCAILAIIFATGCRRGIREGRISPVHAGKAKAGQICAIVALCISIALPILGMLIAFRGDIGDWVAGLWSQIGGGSPPPAPGP